MALSALQAKMKAKLAGGQFRMINEQLYTQTGYESLDMMKRSPEMFKSYHDGFRAQVSGWPQNPLDIMIGEVQRSPAGTVVADFGCGEARLAATVSPHAKVHSFDLVCPPGNKWITACDSAEVPLDDSCVDIAVFCLSLMGTNYTDFLTEANRVLRPGGRLLVAEVKSRFEGGEGGAAAGGAGQKRGRDGGTAKQAKSPGISSFVSAVESMGFRVERRDERNTMFALLFFKKLGGEKAAPAGKSSAASASGSSAAAPSSMAADSKPSKRAKEGGVGGVGAAAGGGSKAVTVTVAGSGEQGAEQSETKKNKKKKNRKNKNKFKEGATAGAAEAGKAKETTRAPVLTTAPAAAAAAAAAAARPTAAKQQKSKPVAPAAAPALKACIYKRR